jgi:hypothetical protein
MTRTQLTLGAAAAVLVVLVLVLVNPFQDSVRRDNPETTELAAGDADRIDRVVIRPPGEDETVLARDATGWRVASFGDFPADTAAVAGVIRAIGGIELGGAVSRNPEKRAIFEVGEEGVKVAASIGDRTVADFVVGKSHERNPGAGYLRPARGDEVYLVPGIGRTLFQRPQGFADRTLAAFDAAAVASVSVAAADTGWTATRSDTVWALHSPDGTEGRAREALVMTVLRVLGSLTADAVVAEPDTLDTGLDDPELVYTVHMVGGEAHTVTLGGMDEQNRHYAARGDRDAVYLLNAWRLNAIRKRAADLLEP